MEIKKEIAQLKTLIEEISKKVNSDLSKSNDVLTTKVDHLNTEMTTVSRQVQLISDTLQKLSKPADATTSASGLQARVTDDDESDTGLTGEYTLDSNSKKVPSTSDINFDDDDD